MGHLPSGGLLLHLLFLSLPGFLYGPLPGQHGFDGLFDGPAVDFFILTVIGNHTEFDAP